jgi:ubiquinone/menaquinone biosynthesis C-methylase UbiE
MDKKIESELKHPLEWTGERILPEPGRYMFRRHLMAYQFALQFCRGKIVLDAGSGEGYGSSLLAEAGSSVTGIDKSEEAALHAAEKYARANLAYQVMDVTKLAFADNSFDVVVSFQVIEHLHDAGKFLEEISRVLKKDGRAIISTTTRKTSGNDLPAGGYHVKEYRSDEFMDLLDAHFEKAEYFGTQFKEKSDSRKLRLADLLVKLDVLRIRRLFPSPLRKNIVMSIEETIALEISGDNLDNALDIIGVCENNK